jgi:hypothetical protein
MLRPFRPLRHDTDIAVPAAPLNALLTAVVSAEASLARRVPMPIGSSLLVIGRKPKNDDTQRHRDTEGLLSRES